MKSLDDGSLIPVETQTTLWQIASSKANFLFLNNKRVMSDSIFCIKDKKTRERYVDIISKNTRTLCQNIGARYWKNIGKKIDFIYVFGKPINAYSLGSELIKGFLIGTEDDKAGHAHILLVCAKPNTRGVGLKLIERVISDYQAENYGKITLEALPQVINYYRNKFNFKLSKTCSEDEGINDLANIVSGRRYETSADAHDDPEMVALLDSIIEAGLSTDPNCLKMKNNGDADYLAECSSNGYWMTLCLDRPKKRKNR